MGLFLHLSTIISTPKSKTVKALKTLLQKDSYKLEETNNLDHSEELCIIDNSNRNSTILFPSFFNHWELSQSLSHTLQTAVLTLEIHDGDFWCFYLYENGNEVLKFNPYPEYDDEIIQEEELRSLLPNADTLCKYFPKTKREDIEHYFIHWKSNGIKHWAKTSEVKKAYPTDDYGYGNGLQLFDFIKKIGISYPIGDNDTISGTLFRLYQDIDPFYAALAANLTETKELLRHSKRYKPGFTEISESELEYLTGFNYKKYIEYFSNTFYCISCKERHAVLNPKSRLNCDTFLTEVHGSCENCKNEISQGTYIHDTEKLKAVFV